MFRFGLYHRRYSWRRVEELRYREQQRRRGLRDAVQGAREVVGRFPDGSFATMGSVGSFEGEGSEIVSYPLHFNRFSTNGEFLSDFVSVPGRAWYGFGVGDRHEYWMVPFMPEPRWAMGTGLFVGTGASFEVAVYRHDVGLTRIIRGPAIERDLRDAVVQRYGEELLADAVDDNERRQIEQFLANVPFARQSPAFGDIRVDALGYLWAERYRLSGEAQPEWFVFDTNGRWLGTVRTPRSLRVFEIGEHYILGLAYGDLGRERVEMYDVAR